MRNIRHTAEMFLFALGRASKDDVSSLIRHAEQFIGDQSQPACARAQWKKLLPMLRATLKEFN